MPFFPYTVTESSITVLIDGTMHKMPKTHAGFAPLAAHLKLPSHDGDLISQLLDKREAVARLSEGSVKILGTTVYYKGTPIHSNLSTKLVTMVEDGFDGMPLARFLDNVMQNPDENAREQVFDFVSRWDAPFTEDGCFVAFKGVNTNYSSSRRNPDGSEVYSRPGDVVKMDRDECDPDPNQTCSRGLHVCASHYLEGFWTSPQIVAVKVNPRDVVSVPVDYKYSKMRVCEYTVLGDITDDRHRAEIEESTVVESDSTYHVYGSDGTPNKGFIVPEGYTLTDDWPEIFNYVVKPGTPLLGYVIEQRELEVQWDKEHPDYDAFAAGDLARNEAEDYIGIFVDFDGNIECFVSPDGEEPELRVVQWIETYCESYCESCGDEIDDDSELCFDCEMDQLDGGAEAETLTFLHVATNQTFTAPQITNTVTEIGQRGFARKYGVPRTTVQEWLKAINA